MKPIPILYLKATEPSSAKKTFDVLESRIGSPQGRKFYGVAFADQYWAAVNKQTGDDPATLGLTEGEIPGGTYAKRTVHNWTSRTHEIKTIFEEMSQEHERDQTRPEIEYYLRHDKLELWLPILPA